MELFTQNFRDPMASAMDGYLGGLQIRAVNQAFADQEMEKQRAQSFLQDVSALGSRPDANAYLDLLGKYPDKAQQLRAGYDMLDAEKQKSMLSQVMPIYTAMHTGNTGVAKQLADQFAQAAENSGDIETAQHMKKYRAALDTNPAFATGIMGTTLAQVLGPEKWKAALTALDVPAAQRSAALESDTKQVDYQAKLFALEQAKAEAPTKAEANRLDLEIKRLQAQNAPMKAELDNQQAFEGVRKSRADAAGAELDAQGKRRTAGLPSIPPQLQSKIVDWQLSAESSRKSAQQARDLAQSFKSIGAPGGVASTVGDWFDRITGSDTPEARARMELERFVNSEVVKSLPPGPATDRDIDLVRRGFPTRNADSKMISAFLDAVGRLSDLASETDQARSEWAETFGTLGKARTSGEVMGVQVMPGTSFNDFMAMKARAGARPNPQAPGAQAPASGDGWSQRRYLQR